MFKLAVTQALYGIKTKWQEKKIQGILVVWGIVVLANCLTWFEKDNIAWFWMMYGFLLSSMSLFAVDDTVFPQVFHFLPITQAKKRSYLCDRASIESIVHVCMIGIMLIIYYVMRGTIDAVILVEAIAFLAFSMKRFEQNYTLGFCRIAGIKHIYDCEPGNKARKIRYWGLCTLDFIAIFGLLFIAVCLKKLAAGSYIWRICGVVIVYCVLSIIWNVRTMKHYMDQIKW